MGKRLFLLIVCVFVVNAKSNAQTHLEQSLTSILIDVQDRFGVQFNYVSDLVVDIAIEAPTPSLTFDETLSYLNQKTKLGFVQINENTISIKEVELLFCGNIKDLDTGERLPYVIIQAGDKGVYANDEGYFELEGLNRNDRIIIKHMGYKPLELEVSKQDLSKCPTIFMVPYQEKLAEITVYDFLVRGMDKLPSGSYRLDLERFSTLPGLIENDVLFSIQSLPGVQSVDESVSNINIRGGSNDQNLITWDGIKMYQSGHFFGLISMYNPHITNDVELRKNGSNASETDGVSGSIAMKTEEVLNHEISGGIGANLIDVNSYIDVPVGNKASFQLASRKAISDLVKTPTYASYFNRIAQDTELENNAVTAQNSDFNFDFYDTSFRLLYFPSERDPLKINFIHTANMVTFDEIATISGSEISRRSNIDQSSIGESLQYHRTWSDKWETDFTLYNTDYKLWAKNVNIQEDQRFLQENKVSETSFKLKAVNKVSSRTSWTNGYQFVETKVTNLDDVDNPLYRRLEGEVLHTHAIFTQIGLISKNSASNLNIGLRFNYLQEFEKQLLEPRLSFNHKLNDHLTLEVLGEFKHQSTSQVINFQNDFLGLEKRRWQLSNNVSAPVITSKQGSVGLLYNKKGWLLNGVVFYKQVNGITTQSQGFQGRYEFEKTSGYYNASGLDFLFRKQFHNNYIWLSYSFLDSDYTFNELPERSFANNFEIKHAITVGTNYHIGNAVFAAGLNWHSGKPISRPVEDNQIVDGEVNYDRTNGNNMPSYLRMDISGKYEIVCGEHTKFELAAALWNVLDRDNELNVFYRPSGPDSVQRFGMNALGITPNLSVKMILN